METEVHIRFDSSDIPGGAQTILGPARCGSDVADVDEVPVLRQMIVWVKLETTDERLPVLIQLLKQHNVDWWARREDHYTDEELEEARLIIMWTLNEYKVFGGPRMGTRYDLENACSACGAGARQTSALIIDGEDLLKLEGRRAASTCYSDIVVDERLAEELERIGAVGLSFRSIYAAMKDKRQVKQRWRQMCAAQALPPMSPRSTGVVREDPCASCKRSGFATWPENPPRLVYRAQDLVHAEDVNTTWEWFGPVNFDGDVSDALFPYPWFLVTPKVMRVIRAAEPKAFRWLPIRVEDASDSNNL